MFTLHPAASKRLASVPDLSHFAVQLNQILPPGEPEAFWQCEAAFRTLLASRFATDLLLQELTNLATDPAHIPFGGLTELDLAVIQSETFILAIRILLPDAMLSSRLSSRGEHCMLGVAQFPGAGEFAYQSYTQPNPLPTDVLDRAKRLIPNGIRTVAPGDMACFAAARDVFSMEPPKQPTILVVLLSTVVARLQWEYDPATLHPIRAIAASSSASRLQYTAHMLSEMGDQSSIPVLQGLMAHDDHFVRWAAVRAVMRLNFDEGMKLLKLAQHDPHPHVKNAATKALAQHTRSQSQAQQVEPRHVHGNYY